MLPLSKAKIKLDDIERCILTKLLYEKCNEPIFKDCYTDDINQFIQKIIDTSRVPLQSG